MEIDMTTLAVAFVLAWTAVALYVGWLGIQNRQLARRLEALEADRSAAELDPYSARAA
jgi:hypothetical protein